MSRKIRSVFLPTFILLTLIVAGMSATFAATKIVNFDTPEQEQLYRALFEEYRCLKCQNQNLADSAADLAGDLRNEIRDQIVAGNTRAEIDNYLVARYGDFVLYRPRLKLSTAALWFGPFVLLFIAAVYALRVVKQHQISDDATAAAGTAAEQVKVARTYLDD